MDRRCAPASLSLALALLASNHVVAAPQIGYAQATGYYKQDARPTLYQPLNVLDAREVTAWCSRTADNLADTLSFGFKGTVKIDEIRIYTGNGFDTKTFETFSRAKKFTLKTAHSASSFSVADHRGLQAVTLNPPLEGAQFTLEILDQYPAEDPEMPVCITDVVFYSNGQALNGAWLTSKLKYDRQRAPLLGTWYAGFEGSADKFLSFYFDDTYRFVYEPYDPSAKGKVFGGSYEASGARITMEVPGKGRLTTHLKRERHADENSNLHSTLTLEGGEVSDLNQAFRDQP